MDFDENELKRMEGIVYSMTLQERQDPDVIDSSRRRRIAAGSGTQPHDVSGLVKTVCAKQGYAQVAVGRKNGRVEGAVFGRL